MRVLVVSGASGGHIFPALGLLDALKEKDKNVESLLILSRKSLQSGIKIQGYNVGYISLSSVRLSLDSGNLLAIYNCFRGTLESFSAILKFKPDIVIGFGSLVCVPMILFAWFFRIKTLIHEQNVIPGKANRFLAKFCDKIAISFAETRKYLKGYERKTVLTGNPMRQDLIRIDKAKALDFFGFKEDRLTLLVMGGSQASHRINTAFFKSLSELAADHNLQVIHLCGQKDFASLDYGYKDLRINYRLAPFLKEMQYAYSASDLAVCRAGATTVSELIFFKLPAVIVPYPFANAHQMANALVLEEKGCALIVKDALLDSGRLFEILKSLIGYPEKIGDMLGGYDSLGVNDANKLLVENLI
jgi:UDP-N-acetylglucosamine--N-acetylmuramyl-(pentapeptide) pyrophosphoryl-undecaprenol N-acetylglucosamine transferase